MASNISASSEITISGTTDTMNHTDKDCLKQLDELLATDNQIWLLGAGTSLNANLPLMGPLTQRVLAVAQSVSPEKHKVLDAATKLLPTGATIEQVLSHFADYLALADRSRQKSVQIGSLEVECVALQELLDATLGWIADTVRWGYAPANGSTREMIGTRERPIVTVKGHIEFVNALFGKARAGLEARRRPVRLFTTNYDTLIEDSLALSCIPYWDGYSGGAIGFRNYQFGQELPTGSHRAIVVKLHGSIDWYITDARQIFRVRDNDTYPARTGRVLIYPQATKYLATQRDPFAAQFDLLRRSLMDSGENVLGVCGYSFGDEHINYELELAMSRRDNKTTMILFTQTIGDVITLWQQQTWADRLYIVTETGVWIGKDGPYAAPAAGKKHAWWTYEGVSNMIAKGTEAHLK